MMLRKITYDGKDIVKYDDYGNILLNRELIPDSGKIYDDSIELLLTDGQMVVIPQWGGLSTVNNWYECLVRHHINMVQTFTDCVGRQMTV